MSEIKEVLDKIGFTEEELKVYNTVVAFSFRTVGQISSYTGLDMEIVRSACTGLMEKNYLKKVEGRNELGDLFLPLAPKISISGDISKRLSERLKSLSTKVSFHRKKI